MAKQSRKVWLALETAQSALAILESQIAEQMHADDRKKIDQLIEKARSAIDDAQMHLTEALRDAQSAIDRI
jgi:ABC-type transporter Mla subunit MlaD